jgi:hypothetical protein
MEASQRDEVTIDKLTVGCRRLTLLFAQRHDRIDARGPAAGSHTPRNATAASSLSDKIDALRNMADRVAFQPKSREGAAVIEMSEREGSGQ